MRKPGTSLPGFLKWINGIFVGLSLPSDYLRHSDGGSDEAIRFAAFWLSGLLRGNAQ